MNESRSAAERTKTREEDDHTQPIPEQDHQREQFRQRYPLAAKMVEDIQTDERDPSSTLRRLQEKFMESGFTYTMAATHPDALLQGTKKEGDCSTLAKAYVKIAQEYFGIEAVSVKQKTTPFFVPGGGKVLDQNNATGNVDNGKHWVFTNHYWVDSPIGSIDLLFLGQSVNESVWINKTGSGEEDGVQYDEFGQYRVYEAKYTGASVAERYATNLAAAKEGQEISKAEMSAMRTRGTKAPASGRSLLSRLFR